jgi:fatty-acyl-CoA synthase
MYLNDWLSRRDLYTPQRVAVVDDSDGRCYSYHDLDARAVRVAHHLQSTLGVMPGDRVACLSGNRIEYLDLYFACGKVGAVLVPLNLRLPPAGIIELLEDCCAKVLVYETKFAQVADTAREAGVVPMTLRIDDDCCTDSELAGQGASTGSAMSLDQVLKASDVKKPAVNVYQADESDTAMILYTSGTTGRAKGAMIPYRQIHWNALNTIIGLQLTQQDTAFLNMPLYHTGGWHVLFTPLMLLGGRVVLQERFDPARCNEQIGPEEITILFGVPTTLRMMWQADNFTTADLSRVRFAIFGGESCPLPVIEAYGQRGVAMRQGYGLTEAGPNCFSLPTEDAIRKQGSIGFPNFHIAARLVNDDGIEVGADEVGELWMKGPHLFSGYWNNQAETAKTLVQGWLATGDLMTRDTDGYYRVVGRKKDMYVSGGENVYPAQVERVLQSHPSVALAAVVGVPDPKWGETGSAFITLHGDRADIHSELHAWCKQRLPSFQCPTRLEVMKELPVGPSGKIDKLALSRCAVQVTS